MAAWILTAPFGLYPSLLRKILRRESILFGPGFVRQEENEHFQTPRWAEGSARSRYHHLLDEMENPPRHDLETW